jgi:hypothetical protein
MSAAVLASCVGILTRLWAVPAEEKDRGSTTENVIWIATLAALALTVGGIFRQQILDAAHSVVFK